MTCGISISETNLRKVPMRKPTLGRVRRGKARGRASGFPVTRDLDSRDKAATMRLYHFVFGREDFKGGEVYRREGFVAADGVRYLGQSVLFVTPGRLGEIVSFLARNRIDHEIIPAALG